MLEKRLVLKSFIKMLLLKVFIKIMKQNINE